MKSALPVPKDGPRINEEIRVREVQLIDTDGAQPRHRPHRRPRWTWPQAAGLDLVEIAPNSAPPVCKILDYGKYKFQEQKKAAEARKKQKVVEVKEIKLRPMIDDHDYEVKMRSMERFFEEGDKVKVTLRFRGREMAHQELGYKLLNRVKDDTGQDRQGRVGAALRRPPDGHDAGAALRSPFASAADCGNPSRSTSNRRVESWVPACAGERCVVAGCQFGRLCHNAALSPPG